MRTPECFVASRRPTGQPRNDEPQPGSPSHVTVKRIDCDEKEQSGANVGGDQKGMGHQVGFEDGERERIKGR